MIDGSGFRSFVRSLSAELGRGDEGQNWGPRSRLRGDLDLDSLEILESVVILEAALGRELAPQDLESVGTLGELYQWFRDARHEEHMRGEVS